MLPADLRRAEAEAVDAIAAALASQAKGFWTAEFRFEACASCRWPYGCWLR